MQCCNDPLHRDSRQPCPGPTLHSPDSDDQSSRAMFPPRLSSVSTNNGNICVRPGRDQHQPAPPAMAAFHKPRIFRSHAGCCICRAKSSRWARQLYRQLSLSCQPVPHEMRRLEFCRTEDRQEQTCSTLFRHESYKITIDGQWQPVNKFRYLFPFKSYCDVECCSSRFTSSSKYEQHFSSCFQLAEVRRGEVRMII